MKQSFLLFLLFFLVTASQGQGPTLEYNTHALKAGESATYQCAEYVTVPITSGANQLWDFRNLKFTTKEINDQLPIAQAPYSGFEDAANVITVVNGNAANYFHVTPSGIEQVGYAGKNGKVRFSEPVKRMVYPFSYKSRLTSQFSGEALFGTETLKLFGSASVEGDAWGTLLLPNGVVYENVLRVKFVYHNHEISQCGTHEILQTKYYYYVKDLRDPVFTILEADFIHEGVVTNSQKYCAILEPVTPKVTEQPFQITFESKVTEFTVYPNPFSESFVVDLTLKEQSNITISLFSGDGKFLGNVVENQLLDAKKHSFNYNAGRLPVGVYFAVCKDGKHIVTKQLVKTH